MTAIMCRLFGHRRQINMSQMFSGALMTCARCDYRSPGRRTYLFGSLRVENGSRDADETCPACGYWVGGLVHLAECGAPDQNGSTEAADR